MAVLQNSGDGAKGDKPGRRGGFQGKDPSQSNIFKIVKMIMERNFAPVIVFSFSKKDCEVHAMSMTKLDFNTSKYIRINYHRIVFQNYTLLRNQVIGGRNKFSKTI